MTQPLPDPICGHLRVGPTGIRWVCTAAPHGPDDPIPPDVDPQFWDRASHYFMRLERLERHLEEDR